MCLDKLRCEPFYRAYKRRAAELLNPRRGGLYLDVGAGTGDDARQLAATGQCRFVAVDVSHTMATTCRDRGGAAPVVADASRLPFGDGLFDGCQSDRTFQHLADPRQALAEMIRVARRGGRILVVDPDYDTQVMEFPDQGLARRVLRFRAERLLRNGALAHRMPAMFDEAGIQDIVVEPMALVVRDPTAVDQVMGLRDWATAAHDAGELTVGEFQRWERLYQTCVETRRFLYAVTFFITSGTKHE